MRLPRSPVRSGETLTHPPSSCIEIRKGRMACYIEPIKANLQEPVPRRNLVLIREPHQHCHKPLLLIKDEIAFFLVPGRDPHRPQGERHQAASDPGSKCK